MKLDKIDTRIIKKIYNSVISYFKSISSIILIGMISIIIFSIFAVGTNRGINSKLSNKQFVINKFKTTTDSVIKSNEKEAKVRVYLTKQKKIKELDLEEYVLGVVSGEMPVTFDIEALKSQAVAARTYSAAHMKAYGGSPCRNSKGADLCDTVHCQVYKSKEQRLKEWPKDLRKEYWNKLVQAVNDTSGQVLTYNGRLVLEPFYFSTSSGKTENSEDVFSTAVPYLRSVESPGENVSSKFCSTKSINYESLVNDLNSAFKGANLTVSNVKNNIKILNRSIAGGVTKMKVGKITCKGPQFRKALKLNSANFELKFCSSFVQINCKGYGHDVGMSQWGANVMAKNHKTYEQILTHYYKGTEIKSLSQIKE